MEKRIPGEFADWLRKFREERGITQKEVAAHLEVSCSTYSYCELGKSCPSIEQLFKLARLFEVDMNTLLHWKE